MRVFLTAGLLAGLFVAGASAASVSYDIIFSGGSPNPTLGTFTYDTTGQFFTSFAVTWDNVNFDLLPSANGPVIQNGCPNASVFAL